jgi:hypothetical protein
LGANASKQRAQERKAQGVPVLNFAPPTFALGFQRPPPALAAPPLAQKSALESMLQEIGADRAPPPPPGAGSGGVCWGQAALAPEALQITTTERDAQTEADAKWHGRRGNAFAALAEPDAPAWTFAPPSFALDHAALAQHAQAGAPANPHAAFHSQFGKAAALAAVPTAAAAPAAAPAGSSAFRQLTRPPDYDSDGSL